MATETVIVALPPVDDKVNRISSEKVPHLTILYLGETDLSADAVLYIEHAASELSPFYGSVEHRGPLGPEVADVLFFEDNGWDFKRVKEFRHYLLLNDEIKRAYDAAPQHEEWTPHVTLGYPDTPANEDDSDYPGIHSVRFDRIAVWMDDYNGPTFRLKYDERAMEVAMSGTTEEKGAMAAIAMFKNDPDAAEQYGTKGMRWGVRKDQHASRGGADKGPTAVLVKQEKPGKFAKAEGGKGHALTDDAKKALEARQKAKASTTDALSNVELRAAVERMQLEQRYTQLEFASDRRSRGKRFLAGFFGQQKELKFKDLDEDRGDKVRGAVEAAMDARSKRNAAA